MSSIDTYSTTKDLVFDEWVSSHRSNEIRFDVYFDGCFFMCPFKYENETILDLRLPMSKRSSKAKNDATTMSFEEIVSWEKEKLQSPSYLRSPHVWKSNSVGTGKGKVFLDDFEIVGNGKDKVVLDDAKDGLISTKSDGDQNEESSQSSNLN
nr:hypothetical protein [Tanacetum cinerariifolium]